MSKRKKYAPDQRPGDRTDGYNLEKLAAMCGYKEQGRIIDKLVREK